MASGFFRRLRGLLGTSALPHDGGMWLVPSAGVHTFAMRFHIDVVALDRERRVLGVWAAVAPGKVRAVDRKTHSVLELHSGRAEQCDLRVGDELLIERCTANRDRSASREDCENRGDRGLAPATRALIVFLLALQLAMCWSARSRSLRGEVDLRAFFAAGSMLRAGDAAHLYDMDAQRRVQQHTFGVQGRAAVQDRTLPFLYPAFAALPFAPLSRLPYRDAFAVWFAFNLACIAGSAWLLRREFPLPSTWLLAAFLAFFPAAIALMQGQLTCVLLLLFTAMHRLLQHRRDFLAGLCLALCLVKFQLTLPVALLFLLWRRARVVAGFVLGGALLAAVSVGLTGWRGVQAYLALLHSAATDTLLRPAMAQLRYGMDAGAEPNLHGLVLHLLGPGQAAAAATLVLSGVALLLAPRPAASSVASPAARSSAQSAAPLALALPFALLVSFHLQPYDLLLLVLPLALLLLKPVPSHSKRLAAASLLLLTAPAGPLLLAYGAPCWLVLPVAGVLLAARLAWRPQLGAWWGTDHSGLRANARVISVQAVG